MRPLPLNTLVELVRLKLYESIVVDDATHVNLQYLCDAFEGIATRAFLIRAVEQLQISKHVKIDLGADRMGLSLNPTGIRAVEKALKDSRSVPARYRDLGLDAFGDEAVALLAAPASDRIVNINHNSPDFVQAHDLLREIRGALQTNNEVGQAFGDQRSVAIKEVELVENLVEQTEVRESTVIGTSKKTLNWIAEKGAGTIVAELAKKLLTLIIGLFT